MQQEEELNSNRTYRIITEKEEALMNDYDGVIIYEQSL